MKLWQTRRHWEKLARNDAFWAVLTRSDKADGGWTPEDFFAGGRREVGAIMKTVEAAHPSLRRGRALDFGCGVGRLTQGLAAHFGRVTGVDIAQKMLARAGQYNRFEDRVDYVHNARPDLAGFDTGAFDFVCSIITLQHIAPAYARRYIAEFVRVLAPGGAAYFQATAVGLPDRKEKWRHSFWPPTLWKRISRFAFRFINRSAAIDPKMEMHGLPTEEVHAAVAAAGGRVIHTHRYAAAGDRLESFAYLVVKPDLTESSGSR